MSRLEELYKTMCDEAPYGFHPSIKKYIMEFAEIYTKECCNASLEKASEEAVLNIRSNRNGVDNFRTVKSKDILVNGLWGSYNENIRVDKSSIVSEQNIIML